MVFLAPRIRYYLLFVSAGLLTKPKKDTFPSLRTVVQESFFESP